MRINYVYIIRVLDYVYVGQHSTDDINDGYLGSGTYLNQLKEFLPKFFFHKQILKICSFDELTDSESYYIKIFKKVFGDKCLNVTSSLDIDSIKFNIKNLKTLIEKIDEEQIQEFTEKLFLKYLDYHCDFSNEEFKFYIKLYDENNNKIKCLKKKKEDDEEFNKLIDDLLT